MRTDDDGRDLNLRPELVYRKRLSVDFLELVKSRYSVRSYRPRPAAEGLGTCWIGAFSQDKVRAVLGVPESAKVIGVMTLGYPADGPRPKRRKPISEIICYDRWQ